MDIVTNSINADCLIKYRGIVKSISTKVDTNGKTYFYIDTPAKNVKREADNTVCCRSFRTGLVVNMPVEVEGVWDEDGFNCTQCNFVWMNEKTTIDYYSSLTKSKNTGIGQRKIEQMVELYGKDIVCMDHFTMQQSLSKDFPTWNLNSINKFVLAIFDTETALTELEQFLSPYNIDYKMILDIYDAYKQDAVKFIKQNPYRVFLQFGISMRLADAVAYAINLPALNKDRINGLVEFYLEKQGSDGHTYAFADELAKELNKFSVRSVYATVIPAICISDAIINNPRVYLDINTGMIALKKLYNAEINIANRLKVISQTAKINIAVKIEEIVDIEKRFRVRYGKDQRHSFYMLEDGGVVVLTGGPGTGKTSTIKGIVEYYKKYYPHANVKFVAPTGRAAKRLSESLDGEYKAYTIDKLVGSKPFETGNLLTYNAANPLDIDFLIVDEMSMVDAMKLEMLLFALKDTTRILFVGDEFQLPSVGAGNCLHDIIASNMFPVYRLTENFRQKDEGTIVDNANLILDGQMPIANDKDFHVIKCEDDENGFETLKNLITKYYDNDDPFKTQVIQPSKKGSVGTYAVNEFVHKTLVHKDENASSDIQPGDKVMFLRNQYITAEDEDEAEPLYVNGEICIIDYIDNNEIVVSDGFSNESKVLPHAAIHDMIHAYSFTIHKSQGSENPIIIIFLPEAAKNMMHRSLLYTAVTRAREMVTIVYVDDALIDCINNTDDAKRNTRLMERLVA